MVSLFEPGRRKRCCLRCPCRCLPKAVLACLVILCMLSSFGCTLTEDMANLALDAPKTYKYATSTDAGERPSLDWWRGFHSVELTQLMEEAQTVNLDIAAAVSRIFQADAQARQRGVAKSVGLGIGDLLAHVRLQRLRPLHCRERGRQLLAFAERELSARFLGSEP